MYINTYFSTNCVQCQEKRETLMDVGKKIKLLRKAENLTQEELANKLNISRVNYTRYETGKVRPDYETLIKIADYFEISLDELFDRKKF